MKERNRTNQQRHQNKVTGVHACMNVSLQTQTFCNNLAKHRWMAFFVQLMRKKTFFSSVFMP